MTLARRNWVHAVFLWLSFATVLVPAVGSYGSPIQRASGSAFSAFTSDVSLGPSRATEPRKEKGQQSPTGADPVAQADAALAIAVRPPAPPDDRHAIRFVSGTDLAPAPAAAPAFRARAPPLP